MVELRALMKKSLPLMEKSLRGNKKSRPAMEKSLPRMKKSRALIEKSGREMQKSPRAIEKSGREMEKSLRAIEKRFRATEKSRFGNKTSRRGITQCRSAINLLGEAFVLARLKKRNVTFAFRNEGIISLMRPTELLLVAACVFGCQSAPPAEVTPSSDAYPGAPAAPRLSEEEEKQRTISAVTGNSDAHQFVSDQKPVRVGQFQVEVDGASLQLQGNLEFYGFDHSAARRYTPWLGIGLQICNEGNDPAPAPDIYLLDGPRRYRQTSEDFLSRTHYTPAIELNPGWHDFSLFFDAPSTTGVMIVAGESVAMIPLKPIPLRAPTSAPSSAPLHH